MAAIILPRKHYTQPQGRVTLDQSNPLTDRASVIYLGSENRDVLRDQFGTPGGNLQFLPTGEGMAASSMNLDGWVNLPAHPARGTAPITMWWAGRLGAFGRGGNANEGGVLFSFDAQPAITWGNRVGGIRRFYYLDAWQNYVQGPEMSEGEDVALVAVRTATHIYLYKNGHLGTTTTQSARNYGSTTEPTINTLGPVTGASWSANSQTLSCGLILNAWSHEQVAEFSAKPWQLFKADPTRIYSLPPVLTIPSLSNPGVIDITATSARPQVTLAY